MFKHIFKFNSKQAHSVEHALTFLDLYQPKTDGCLKSFPSCSASSSTLIFLMIMYKKLQENINIKWAVNI